jgi:ribulose-phosphate 3-epimerase
VNRAVPDGPQLSVGINTADLGRLADELAGLEGTGVWAHVDIMDGCFVPALTVGAPIVRAAAAAALRIDAHVMVEEPRRFLPDLVEAGAGVVTVHAESTRHLHRTFLEMTELASGRDLVRGIGLNPGTPVAAIEPVLELVDLVLILAVNPGFSGESPAANTARRVHQVRRMADEAGIDVLIGVDGGVTFENAREMASWNLDVIVSGKTIFDGSHAPTNLARMQQVLAGAVLAAPATRKPAPNPTRTSGDVA